MPIRHEVIALLQLKPGDTVLDAVSGTGLSFSFLIEAVGPSGHVVAIEHSPEMMALARIAVAGAPLSHHIRSLADALAFPRALRA